MRHDCLIEAEELTRNPSASEPLLWKLLLANDVGHAIGMQHFVVTVARIRPSRCVVARQEKNKPSKVSLGACDPLSYEGGTNGWAGIA